MQEKNRDFSILKLRILQYIESKGLKKNDLYTDTGITTGVFSQPNGISEDNLLRFLNKYTDISEEWLLKGEGNMIKTENISKENSEDEILGLYRKLNKLQDRIDQLETELTETKRRGTA